MEKKIAVIYTGEARTIETTIKYFRENVLINNNFHVFATLQSDNIEYFDKFVKDNIGDNLKHITWLNKNDAKWNIIRDELLNKMVLVEDRWKNYLRNSGSMIEYYQMYLAYKNIEEYENANGIEYNYIMRIRCDVILTQPIYFDWDDYSIDIVKEFLDDIKNEKQLETIVTREVFITFMNSFHHKNRMLCKKITYGDHQHSDHFKQILSLIDESSDNKEEEFVKAVHNYLLKGNYIVTLRKNIIYFMKRHLFKNIAELGVTYGTRIMHDNPYWFNAETQLELILIENGIDIYETVSNLEGESLYSYQENNYFENNQLKKTPDCLFFIKRY